MSTDTLYQQLREHLHYLKLTAVAEQLAPALERAELLADSASGRSRHAASR